MLDDAFCTYLECEISKALEYSTEKELKGFWCDGIIISLPYNEVSKKNVNDRRKVSGTVYIGKDGQGKYELIIYFGKYALRRYAKGTRMEDCVPDSETDNWISINIQDRVVEIKLY